MSPNEVRAALVELTERLAASRRLVEAGAAVDLAGLDKKVERLCQELGALSPDQQGELKLPLAAVIDDLDKLAGAVRQQYEQLSTALRSMASGTQAARAYGKGGALRK